MDPVILAEKLEALHWCVRRIEARRATSADELQHLHVCAVGRVELERAQSLGWADFDDAVVAATAERAGCTSVITRNVKDFAGSPVPVLTPQEFLLR